MAEEIYDPSWDANAAESRPYAGAAGIGSQGRNILADIEGFFGFSIGKATNLIINVQAPERSGNVVRNLILKITYPNQPAEEVINYDQSYVYERVLPFDTPITLTTSGGQYKPTSQTFSIAGNTILSILIQLMFNQAYALSSRSVWS